MEKHLLLTISEGAPSSYSLRFVNNLFDSFDNIRLTLLYVTRPPMRYSQPGASEAISTISAMKMEQAESTLQNAKQWLLDFAGCDASRIETKVISSGKGTVREIVEEAHKGLYDCTVIGRRAYSWLEEIVEDSVTQGILWNEIDFPVWICKKPPETPRKGVLLCAGHSDPSLRISDHVGYMLAEHTQHSIDVLHVKEKDEPDSKIDDLFGSVLAELQNNGVAPERVSFRTAPPGRSDKIILKENQKNNYAAICLGMRDSKAGTFKTLYPNILALRLLRQLHDTALWISK